MLRRHWNTLRAALIAVVLITLTSGGASRLAYADAVTDWNENAGEAAKAACMSPGGDPLHESRMYAIMHIAIHDALNAIDRRSRPYTYDSQVSASTSAEAAVAAAAHDVLVTLIAQLPAPFPQVCLDAGIASAEADYTAALAAIANGTAKSQGITVGQAAAAAILALRANDGSNTTLRDTAYPQGTVPGAWRFTPGFPFAFAPGWANVTPFVLKDTDQYSPGPPYKLTSKKYAEDLNEVKTLGVKVGSTRTAEQTKIGHFWVESSPLAWNRIARAVSAAEGLDLWENARLFGLLNMTLADGYIGTFEAKYFYNFWRPVTAIQLADTDGNPDTTADPAWEPLLPTPPIPDYDSGHSVEGGAAAQVLKRFFKDDDVSFTACSLTLPAPEERCGGTSEVRRSFTSFTQAAEENGVSRIYNGFHFRNAVNKGIKHGRKIADRAVSHFLKPVH
jgi:hypothetical protein